MEVNRNLDKKEVLNIIRTKVLLMKRPNLYTLAMDALVELAPEIAAADKSVTLPAPPTLAEVLTEISPIPRGALFLGMAEDGLPVLLNLHDSVPGPLLICADQGAGKTTFLQLIARALIELHDIEDVQFGVITAHAEEWHEYEKEAHCAGVFPFHEKSGTDFILSLGSWAHANKSLQSVLLLVDDLTQLENTDPEMQDTLRWLFLRGPARHVWPIVSLDPFQFENALPWLSLFRTRIFGAIKDANLAESITQSARAGLGTLIPDLQFKMREETNWLQFWLPRVND